VRTWIVTGDKNSTAKSIGYTSGVFSAERNIVPVDDLFEGKIARSELIRSLQDGRSDLLISGKAIC